MRDIKKRLFHFAFVALAMTSAALCRADRIDSLINNALTKTGKIVKCSPYGKVPGTLSLEAAAKKIRSGMILRMLPGHYNPKELIIFSQDKIIIEGDKSGGSVNVPLILYGKNCIVRNIRTRTIEGGSLIAANVVAHQITITSGKKRGKPILFNCAMNYLNIYPNAQDIVIKNCTSQVGVIVKDEGKVVQTWSYTTRRHGVYSTIRFGDMVKKGKLTFDRCILYTDGHLFRKPNKLLALTMQDNIIYCSRSLITVELKKTEIKSINALKEYFTFKDKGGNMLTKPIFVRTPNPNNSWDTNRDCFILTPKSPGFGKNIGVNMGPKGIPELRTPGKKKRK